MEGSNDKKSRVGRSSNLSIPHDLGIKMMMLWANTSVSWNIDISILIIKFWPKQQIETEEVQIAEQKRILYSLFVLEDDKAEQLRF